MDDAQNLPSRATRPDLDWSQIRETVLMLNAAVAQIRNGMTEGDDSVNALTASFMTMVEQLAKISDIIGTMPATREHDELHAIHAAVASRIDEAIISFQFYDKMTQRLAHVTNSLSQLADLVHDPNRLFNPTAWQELQTLIKSRYTVQADRQMFELILSGASVEEALSQSAAIRQSTPSDANEIELF